MSEKAPNQASSKEDLDQLSAFEESMASLGMGDLDSENGVILKDWSAQDFANIYVRFRPHLITHARKFLRDETQAEEVVQDAFLYLMTALPELDSELGVLRFLKWKTKMLCLDIIRSSQAGLNNNIVPLPAEIPDETQPIDSLERADDAAIIRLALAKLNPRHREALISTIYEEKSISTVATELELSPNASRQLLHRARRSFKVSLKSVLEDKGVSLESFLSGRFAKQLGVVSSIAGAFVLFGIANSGIFGLSSITQASLSQDSLLEVSSDARSSTEREEGQATAPPFGEWEELEPDPLEVGLNVSENLTKVDEDYVQTVETESAGRSKTPPASDPADGSESDQSQTRQHFAMAQVAGREFLDSLISATSHGESKTVVEPTPGILELEISSHARLSVGYSNIDFSPTIDFFWLTLSPDEKEIVGIPQTLHSTLLRDDTGSILTLVATDFVLGDLGGHFGHIVNADSPLSFNGVLLKFEIQGENLSLLEVSFSNRESDST